MAVAVVFAVPELHEAILWHTDMLTVLVSAQRVSKAWRALITTSPALQQKLFFQPIPGDAPPTAVAGQQSVDDLVADTTDWCKGKATDDALPWPTRNPLLVKYFSPCFFEIHDKAYFRQANAFMALPWTPNPRREELDEDGIMRSIHVDPPEDAYVQPFRQQFHRSGASWRRMLVTQPSVRQLGYIWSTETVEGPFFTSEYVARINSTTIPPKNDGTPSPVLRMGQLYDLVQERACRHDLHCLRFRVHWDTMQEPAYCEESQALGARLIAQSRVVVEFVSQEYPSNSPKDPQDPDVFDHVFRCDEHERVETDSTCDEVRCRVVWPDQHIQGMISKFATVYDNTYRVL